MNRRQFPAGSMSILGGAGIGSQPAAADRNSRAPSIQLKVDAGHASSAIAPDFIGFGYETASVAKSLRKADGPAGIARQPPCAGASAWFPCPLPVRP